MNLKPFAAVAALAAAGCGTLPQTPALPPMPYTPAEILSRSSASDWRTPDPENTLYVELATGRVIIELAPEYAPNHAANIRALAREKYFDGLAVIRSQENYVVQWGDPEEDEKKARPIKVGKPTLAAEFFRSIDKDLPFAQLPDGDVYAPQVGLAQGMPAARDPAAKKTWLTHCYGMVGAARGQSPDSGSGSQLYVVIGHAPRHLDKNVTLVGRVIKGMELLTTLPRGTGALGFYEHANQRAPLRSVKVAADVPVEKRTKIEVLRTDTETFTNYMLARRTRAEDWFVDKAARIEVCNILPPVR